MDRPSTRTPLERWRFGPSKRANERLAARGLVPLPEGLTPHSMRRTFISLLLAIGEDAPYVMGQVGDVDPKVTLSIYAQVMFRGEGETQAKAPPRPERARAALAGRHPAGEVTGQLCQPEFRWSVNG
jgi:integrase